MLMQRKISQFLASTAPIGFGVVAGLMAATAAHADTTVSTGTTGNLATSTAGSVTIAGTGTLTGASGAVITVDSANNATVNANGNLYAGTATAPLNGNIGILVNPGFATTVTNAGTISVLENYTPPASSINGTFITGPVSGVSGRYGIYGAAGGTVNATISNTGGITVDGENSAGIQIDSALNGSLNTQGAITVLGDNSYGVKLNAVTGNVTIGGTVSVIGSSSQGYVQSGAVSGTVVIDGSITNGTGYTDSSGTALVLNNISTHSPIVEIDGSVAGGILINAPTSSTSTDTNRGSITANGDNTALQIGGTTNIVIGANPATDNGSANGTTNSGSFALGIDGSVTATSTNPGDNATAVSIGGKGGTVNLTNGMEVYGTVTASTSNANATAILINQGATVTTIFNTGTIKAIATGTKPASGGLFGIQDLSNTLTSITNQGYITVTGASVASTAAIDLSKSTGNFTLTQGYTSTNASTEATDKTTAGYNPYTATEYAGITGNILLGTGNNTLNIGSGTITGNTVFGAGGSNVITMADTTRWVGNITYGAGGTQKITMGDYAQFTGNLALSNDTSSLTINNQAIFLGAVSGGANLNVAVNNTGIFGANATGISSINSLTVASGASLRVYIDGTTQTSSQLVANTATFASGAKLSLALNSLKTSGSFDVLHATTLTGAPTLAVNLPVLFTGSLTTTATDISINIAPASAAQLGLTSAQASAYNAIINDASANTNIQNTLLQIYDAPTLRGRFNELLPNYSGGTFDIVSRATRIANKHFDNDSTMFSISDTAAWLEPIVFSGTRAYGDTPGFKTSGAGISAGLEKVTPVGNIGFQLAYLSGNVKSATFQRVKASEVELGLFWRKSAGPLYFWAGGNLGREAFDSTRTFFGEFSTTTSNAVTVTNFTYSASGHWAGWSAAATAGASYTAALGEHFSLRPRGFLEYDHLNENSYIESGDTPIALTVAGRKTSQTTATTTLTGIWSVGPSSHEGRPFSVEIEAGRRSWISGDIGTTTATFETGDTFSINGGHLPSAWLGGLSIVQGGLDYTWRLGTDFERGSDKGVAYGVRASIAIAL